MISMEMLGKIRRMYFRDKLSLHQIAKRTGLSRNTIRKWVRAPEATQPAYQRCATFNKLSPFHETLEQALKADSFRPKHNRRSAKALFEKIKAEGYDGGYSQLTAFVRSWRGEQGKSLRAFVPLTFALGEAFQFDWSEEGLLIGGLFRRIQVSHMKLCASRAFWLVAYPSQGHEMLFDAHTRSFGALGGVPRRGIYDNLFITFTPYVTALWSPGVLRPRQRSCSTLPIVVCLQFLVDDPTDSQPAPLAFDSPQWP